jgi:hypothetical protein
LLWCFPFPYAGAVHLLTSDTGWNIDSDDENTWFAHLLQALSAKKLVHARRGRDACTAPVHTLLS